MPSGMNRRHCLRTLFGLVAGAWAVGRVPAAALPLAPPLVTSYDIPLPQDGCRHIGTFIYDAANRLIYSAEGTVTTVLYDGPGSSPCDG